MPAAVPARRRLVCETTGPVGSHHGETSGASHLDTAESASRLAGMGDIENAADGWLWGGPEPLADRYDLALLDLDGVVYLVGEPIEGAPAAIAELRRRGGAVVFVTNNASRSPAEVAELLTDRGVTAAPREVLTSSRTAASLMRDRLPADSTVMVVGAAALAAEVSEVGLRPVWPAESTAVSAVVQGFGPAVGWEQLAEAAIAVREGAWWVATNPDRTMPSPRGELPGNGSLLRVVATAAGREPDVVAGKPGPAMFRQAAEAHSGASPIVVGDRWDTDIAGGRAAGLPGLLVLSGSTSPAQVLRIPPEGRPRYLAWTVAGMLDAHPEVTRSGDEVHCGGWRVRVDGADTWLAGSGEPLDALRAMAEAAWSWLDTHPGEDFAMPKADGTSAAQALDVLRMSG